MSHQDSYCIRDDYEPRTTAETIEEAPGDYWTNRRRRAAAQFQYDVYSRVAKVLRGRPRGRRAVVDVGCGYPWKANALLKPVADRVVAMDQPSLAEIVEKEFPSLEFRSINLENPDRNDSRFDVVLCADVIEHLLNPDECLEFLRSHQASDGLIVLSTPERRVLRGADCLYSPKPEHVREWTREEFSSYLVSRGFEVLDHQLLPEKRLPLWLRALPKSLISNRESRRFAGCQFVMCRYTG